MDGNGRWATRRGLPRAAGHRAGAEAVRRVVAAAPELGVRALTLFAFSADNWKRPPSEVAALMRLFARHLQTEAPKLAERGVRLDVVGRRDRLPAPLVASIAAAERATRDGAELRLRLAVDYSAREAIFRAACRYYKVTEVSRASFAEVLAEVNRDGAPDVDLLIRTGGEQRLSDFLLWESAYAELVFTPRMWPEFSAADLRAAVEEFHARERRFGRLPDAAAS